MFGLEGGHGGKFFVDEKISSCNFISIKISTLDVALEKEKVNSILLIGILYLWPILACYKFSELIKNYFSLLSVTMSSVRGFKSHW